MFSVRPFYFRQNQCQDFFSALTYFLFFNYLKKCLAKISILYFSAFFFSISVKVARNHVSRQSQCQTMGKIRINKNYFFQYCAPVTLDKVLTTFLWSSEKSNERGGNLKDVKGRSGDLVETCMVVVQTL